MVNGHTLYRGKYPENEKYYGIWYDGEHQSPDWILGYLHRVDQGIFSKGFLASDAYAKCPNQIGSWKEFLHGSWTALGDTDVTVRCLTEGRYFHILRKNMVKFQMNDSRTAMGTAAVVVRVAAGRIVSGIPKHHIVRHTLRLDQINGNGAIQQLTSQLIVKVYYKLLTPSDVEHIHTHCFLDCQSDLDCNFHVGECNGLCATGGYY